MFRFNYDKAVQAIAQILRDEPSHRLNYMRLIKLVYMADRESLRETGRPITGDRVVAMDRGTVLSNVYDLVKGQHLATPDWSRFFRTEHYELVMIEDPGNGKLCKYEAEKLAQVKRENQDLDEWDLADKTHNFSEWQRNKPAKGSSTTIPATDILEAVGYDQDGIERVRTEARAESALAQLIEQTDRSSRPSAAP